MRGVQGTILRQEHVALLDAASSWARAYTVESTISVAVIRQLTRQAMGELQAALQTHGNAEVFKAGGNYYVIARSGDNVIGVTPELLRGGVSGPEIMQQEIVDLAILQVQPELQRKADRRRRWGFVGFGAVLIVSALYQVFVVGATDEIVRLWVPVGLAGALVACVPIAIFPVLNDWQRARVTKAAKELGYASF